MIILLLREELDILLENKNFLKNNRGFMYVFPFFILISMIITALYGVNREYVFYFIAFYIISYVIAIIIQYMNYKKQLEYKRRQAESETADKDNLSIEKNREHEDFFALWTHQIKTPISALNILLQTQDINRNECREELIKIEDYVNIALGYIRYDNMGNDLVLEEYNLNEMVKNVIKKYATVFIHNNLTVDINNLDYKILTDDKWFSFVLEQVMSNALKYTKEGGITVSAEEYSDGLKVMIADTGIGIKSEDVQRVFEKGFTGYNGRMDKKASGIGLYLSRKICERLGHKIEIESEINRGTTVIIKIEEDRLDKADLIKD